MSHNTPSVFYPKTVDLNNCDKEPIHILGNIQSHGVLIACDSNSHTISHSSGNIARLFPSYAPDTVLGKKLSELLDSELVSFHFQEVEKMGVSYQEIIINQQQLTLIAHKNDKEYIFEFEWNDITLDPFAYQKQLTSIVSDISTAGDEQEMCERSARLIKSYLHYDRVMIYQFDADWNGAVVAEAKEDELESWLGLHYPATDIPKQARALFLRQGVRIISDVNSIPVPISSKDASSPLDLAKSELRSVSPIHIKYLQNMQVNATLTAAIVHNNTLWGLVACHHYSPKYINYYQRLSCKSLVQIFGTHIGLTASNTLLEKSNMTAHLRGTLIEQISRTWNIADGLSKYDKTLMDINESTGAAICINGEITLVGDTPEESQVVMLLDKLQALCEEDFYYTTQLTQDVPEAHAFKEKASGALYVLVSKNKREALLWFKPEKLQTVSWGGNPEKSVNQSDDGELMPRKSFEKWITEQEGTSEPWKDYEIFATEQLKKDILEIVIEKYEEVKQLNENLQKAYQELESYSYSISHDLRAPLRGIDGFAQIIKEDYYDILDDLGKSAVQTIISAADKMNVLIDSILSYSRLGQKSIHKDHFSMTEMVEDIYNFIKVNYPQTRFHLQGNLPPAYGDRSLIYILISNLLENAFKYSSKADSPEVHVGYDPETPGLYFIKDNGIGIDKNHYEKVFGVFERLVGDQEYKGSGIGLAIAKRVIEKHKGKIWIESEPGQGSVFWFKFNL